MRVVLLLSVLCAALAASSSTPTSANCTLSWFTQTTDHFSWKLPAGTPASFQQRVYTYDKWWKPDPRTGKKGPIFFYTGNEGDVTLYVNHTGLMWENGEKFGALLVFAEHRYFGLSVVTNDLTYLTHEQALADYATLLYDMKNALNANESPVIAFGGSYGGMLSSWMRMKYPGTIAGAIAASAPIFGFPGFTPEYDTETFWRVVTRDATPAAGAPPGCTDTVRAGFAAFFDAARTPAGRDSLAKTFSTCNAVTDPLTLAMFLLNAFDLMAMGNYPYPSSYLTGGQVMLPAWPMRAACVALGGVQSTAPPAELLRALRRATDVLNNATGRVKCNDVPDDIEYDGIWDYMWCTELMPQETYFSMDGVNDMFWRQPLNWTFIEQRCAKKYSVSPRRDWIRTQYGDRRLDGATNIVFSNGLLDPWSSAGVRQPVASASVVLVTIPNGAHHIDLMFSDPQDTPDIVSAREVEMTNVRRWIDEAYDVKQ